jgi:hypothetical protein
MIGKVYGLPVIVSNALADGEFFAFEKSAVVFGFQAQPAYDEGPALEYGAGAKKRVLDALYGISAVQVDGGGLCPLIVKHGV